MSEHADAILSDPALASTVVHRRRFDAVAPTYGDPATPLAPDLRRALDSLGVGRLYRHQAEALDLARAGANVVAVTPTASGKTLVFALPVLESILDDGGRALFVYPTKALAQDQLASLRALASAVRPLRPPRFEIYDGDTPDHVRRRIRANPPEVLITNPDMLHMGILAHHHDWERFLGSLRWVVLDELHVYRGVFGAHVHHILARLRRLAGRAGSRPRFVAASATIGNPGEFAARLTGEPFEVVATSGAAVAARQIVFLNPHGVSPYTTALRVISRATQRDLRTIAFTKARRITELLHTWLARQEPALAKRVAPYRAGYRPEERRRIEARLFHGDLRAVITTSALELGIDVGDLDVCVLVGYPGSRMSTWQRIGRVGRSGRESLAFVVAMPDALDQYIVGHPDEFFEGRCESAVLDPWNPVIAGAHLVCAAAEAPLAADEIDSLGGGARELVATLEDAGRLRRDEGGEAWFSFRRRPHRDVHPRSAGSPFAIVVEGDERHLGTIDAMRVYHECHPEAIYLHGGESWRVLELDEDRRRAVVRRADVDYFTAVLGEKETEILERRESREVAGLSVGLGRVRVTVRIRGFQKKRLFGGETISEHALEAPPLVFETAGTWIEMPRGWSSSFAQLGCHFMGSIHAAEHAMIGMFPLLAISDRGDVGGISYVSHPQTGGPALFLYDGVPGGAGLVERAFRELESLIAKTAEVVHGCPCEDGCPACIQSPRCGNGNKPLDKGGCRTLLDAFAGRADLPTPSCEARETEAAAIPMPRAPNRRHGITRKIEVPPPAASAGERVVVFDLETRRGAEEVGGWGNVDRMGLALAVTYDVSRDLWSTYLEGDVDRLILDLVMADRVVGFNVDRFDLRVLSAYTAWDLGKIRTFDMLEALRGRLGFRVSLQHLAEVNLGETKSADGLQSLRWWQEGKVEMVEQYCRKDVEITWKLWRLGREQGFLLYRDREERRLRIPTSW